MIEVHPNLWVSNLEDARKSDIPVVVHACKIPCHRHALGYEGNLTPEHGNYLYFWAASDLYLNILDTPKILPKFANPIFHNAMLFIHSWRGTGVVDRHLPVLIHCNQGRSRSAAIAMVYLAQIGVIGTGVIAGSDEDSVSVPPEYDMAYVLFNALYPPMELGEGIEEYLRSNWDRLMEMR